MECPEVVLEALINARSTVQQVSVTVGDQTKFAEIIVEN